MFKYWDTYSNSFYKDKAKNLGFFTRVGSSPTIYKYPLKYVMRYQQIFYAEKRLRMGLIDSSFIVMRDGAL